MGRNRKTSLRFAKGGQFKREDFGDLGLGAFKNQQNQIIDSIKLQQSRQKEYDSEYAQGLGNVARNEVQNQETLNSLENKIYQNKKEAIQNRKRTEVQKHQDQARIYEKEAAYWKELTPKASKNFAALAKGSWDLADDIISDKALKELDENGGLASLIANEEETEAKITNNITLDTKKHQDNPEVARTLRKQGSLFHTKFSKVVSKRIQDNKKYIEGKIKELNPDLTHTTASGVYKDFVKGMLTEAGISNRTKGYKDAMDLAASMGNAKSIEMKLDWDVIEDKKIVTTKLEEHLGNINGNHLSRSATYNALVEAIDAQTRPGQYGGLPQRINDRGGSNLSAASVLANKLIAAQEGINTKKLFNSMTYDLDTLSGPGVKPITWQDRHGINNDPLNKEIWSQKVKSMKAAAAEVVETDQLKVNEDIRARLNPENENYIDIKDPTDNYAGRRELIHLLQQNKDNLYLKDLWKDVVYAPKSTVPWVTQMFLQQDAEKGNWRSFNSRWSSLSQAEQNAMAGLHDKLQAVQQIKGKGDVTKLITKKATTKINSFDKLKSPNSSRHDSNADAIKAYEVNVWNNFFSEKLTKEFTDASERLEEAFKITNQLVDDGAQGVGIFRRGDPVEEGGAMIWLNWHDEDHGKEAEMSLDWMHQRAVENGHNWETFKENMTRFMTSPNLKDGSYAETQDGKGFGYIVENDEIDIAYRSLESGRPLPGNKNITRLSQLYNIPEHQVWNDLFNLGTKGTGKGDYQFIVKPNAAAEAERKAKNISAVLPEYFTNIDKVSAGVAIDAYKFTGQMPMKTHIRRWWGRQEVELPSFEQILDDSLGLENSNALKLHSTIAINKDTGRVQLTYEDSEEFDPEFYQLLQEQKSKLFRDLTFSDEYWYDPNTNEFVPNPS